MITIGIGANWDTQRKRLNMPNDYITAVIRAGGLPLLFPLTDNEAVWKAMIDKVDGVIFPGGEDIHPREFGEEIIPQCDEIVPERDAQELYTYRYLLTTGKPFLAVCRGIQLMNVAQGGTLYQDMPTQKPTSINHSQNETPTDAHKVSIIPGTLLHSLIGSDTSPVNSRHHQNIKDLGKGLKVAAMSEDGFIEAVEFEDGYPAIGLQWHPENLAKHDPAMQRLFDWLIEQAGKRA